MMDFSKRGYVVRIIPEKVADYLKNQAYFVGSVWHRTVVLHEDDKGLYVLQYKKSGVYCTVRVNPNAIEIIRKPSDDMMLSNLMRGVSK